MATEYPVVLILSNGDVSPEEIIKNIRNVGSDVDVVDIPQTDVKGFRYEIVTKYYKTDIAFVAFNDDIRNVPPMLNVQVEGIFIYFNSKDRKLLKSMENYAEYVEKSDIELGILLCDQLVDNEIDGITYREVKEMSKSLDVIELGRTKDEEFAEANSDHHDPIGYDEVQQVLRSFLWSNVQANMNSSKLNKSSQTTNENSCNEPVAENDIEQELAGFETLLSELMAFRQNSSTWSRNERLAFTESIAVAFGSLLGEESTTTSDDESHPTPD